MPGVLPFSYSTVSLMMLTLPAAMSLTNVQSAHFAHYGGQAQALVSAKLAKFYSMPLTQEVPILQAITTDISLYYLLVKRVFTGERMNKSEWPDRFKMAMDILDDISTGKLPLLDSAGVLVTGRGDIAEVWTNNKGYRPTFHDGEWESMAQDPNMLDDIESERSDL